jgi:4Fe-4S ferredoxin
LPKLRDLVSGETRVDVDKCINCYICEEMCPSSAIKIKTDDNSNTGRFESKSIEFDEENCMYCKICQKVCPVDAIKVFCTTCMDSDNIPLLKSLEKYCWIIMLV